MKSKITVYSAKKIITMSSVRPKAEAVAVRDGIILGAGSFDELKGWGEVERDDRFQDKVIIPGLIEAHSHLLEGSLWMFPYVGYFGRKGPDGKQWNGCQSPEEVVAKLKELDAEMAPDKPLVAWGLDPIYFTGKRMDATHLDQASSRRPIFILHASGHLATVNSALMKRTGISRDTDVEGVVKDSNGDPVGELQEPKAMKLAGDIFADIWKATELDDAWQMYGLQARNAGCTTIGELAMASPNNQSMVDRLKRIVDDPEYPVRVAALYTPAFGGHDDPVEGAKWAVTLSGMSTAKLRLGIVKLVLDGSIQGFTARLNQPGYYNGHKNGIWLMPPESMEETVRAYHEAGLSIHCHCNGTEAVDVFVDAVEKAQSKSAWLDARHTVEHCQLTTTSQYKRMASLGMCANIFSNHIFYWGDQHYAMTVGPDRAERMEACRTASSLGVPYTMHSDAPITPIGQLHTAWCAVNRLTATGRVLGEFEKLSVQEALYAVTMGAAHVLNMDGEVGSIEPGKLADFTILEADPFAISAVDLKDIEIWGTMVGGKAFISA